MTSPSHGKTKKNLYWSFWQRLWALINNTMRPIKFRWLTLSWKWVYGDYTSIPEMQNAMIFTASEDGMHSTEEVKRETVWQFTWLLDNNWKEIYEGDIVFSEEWNPTTYSVEFERWAFCFWYPWCYQLTDCKYLEKFEVIWNIYENLELLTKNLWA